MTVTAGMGGRGKSSNSLVEAIAMVTPPLLGEAPAERFRVWYHSGNDNMEELLRRVVICQHYNIDMRSWRAGYSSPRRASSSCTWPRGYGC